MSAHVGAYVRQQLFYPLSTTSQTEGKHFSEQPLTTGDRQSSLDSNTILLQRNLVVYLHKRTAGATHRDEEILSRATTNAIALADFNTMLNLRTG